MALETNELYVSTSQGPWPRIVPSRDGIVPVAFTAVSGGLTIPGQTPIPIVRNSSTGEWTVYTQGGTNGEGTIKGFLYEEEEVTLNDSGSDDTETLLNVMIAGTIHRDDVNTAAIRALLLGSPTEGNLDTALGALNPGTFIVQGLGSAFPA